MAPMPHEGMDTLHTPRTQGRTGGGGGGGQDALATRRTERGKGRAEGRCAPVGGVTLQVDIPGPKSRRWGGVLNRRCGVPLANGEGSCPPLCGPDTEQ